MIRSSSKQFIRLAWLLWCWQSQVVRYLSVPRLQKCLSFPERNSPAMSFCKARIRRPVCISAIFSKFIWHTFASDLRGTGNIVTRIEQCSMNIIKYHASLEVEVSICKRLVYRVKHFFCPLSGSGPRNVCFGHPARHEGGTVILHR